MEGQSEGRGIAKEEEEEQQFNFNGEIRWIERGSREFEGGGIPALN